jgi:hypothetical protein
MNFIFTIEAINIFKKNSFFNSLVNVCLTGNVHENAHDIRVGDKSNSMAK